jgi:hypothetical protein
VIAVLALAVTAAHADPDRTGPWRALLAPNSIRLEHLPHPRIERAPREDHGLDAMLALAVDRMTHLASKVATTHHGIGPYVHVENVVSAPKGVEAAPRVIVIGISFGPSRIR